MKDYYSILGVDKNATYDDILKGLNALLEFVKSKNNS